MSAIYFAWVGPNNTTFLPEYAREDEEVFDFSLDHTEGEFAGLTVDIKNPRIGLLHSSRSQWVWLSYEGDDTGGVIPIFFGRLVAIPENLHEEIVTLEFIARPKGYEDIKSALAETLKVRPFYDPIWIPQENRQDADTAIEARSAHWHIDRITHDVTISDIIYGEDGTFEFGVDDVFYESLTIRYGSPPVRSITVEAEAHWTQEAAGTSDLSQALSQAFRDAGSQDSNRITSYTGEGLAKNWPDEGTNIGAGWTIGRSELKHVVPVWQWDVFNDGTFDPDGTAPLTESGVFSRAGVDYMYALQYGEFNWVAFPLYQFVAHLEVNFVAERSFVERLTFTLKADVQSVLVDADEEESTTLNFSTRDISEPLDDGDTSTEDLIPIGDIRNRSYFNTERGHQSLEWLMARARSELLEAARVVDITFDVSWEAGLDLSCRHNVHIVDPRISGGEATGKVIGYSLFGNGDAGEFGCTITISCAVGHGNSVSAVVGDPDYVEEDYVESDYQLYLGASIEPVTGMTYDDYIVEPNDDGLIFRNEMNARDVLLEFTDGSLGIVVHGGVNEHEEILGGFESPGIFQWLSWEEACEALNLNHTEVCIFLKPLNEGPYETDFEITVSNLMVPKMIDLEAASNGP